MRPWDWNRKFYWQYHHLLKRYYLEVIQKVRLVEISKFWAPCPLVCPFSFSSPLPRRSKHGIHYLSWRAFCRIVSPPSFTTLDLSVLHVLRILFISANDLLLKKSCGSEIKYVYWKFKTFELWNTSTKV